jgi:hypothetical protein
VSTRWFIIIIIYLDRADGGDSGLWGGGGSPEWVEGEGEGEGEGIHRDAEAQAYHQQLPPPPPESGEECKAQHQHQQQVGGWALLVGASHVRLVSVLACHLNGCILRAGGGRSHRRPVEPLLRQHVHPGQPVLTVWDQPRGSA